LIGEMTNTLPSGDSAHALIALIRGFDGRLKALETIFEARAVEVQAASELETRELTRLEWEVRDGLAEANAAAGSEAEECGCTVDPW